MIEVEQQHYNDYSVSVPDLRVINQYVDQGKKLFLVSKKS